MAPLIIWNNYVIWNSGFSPMFLCPTSQRHRTMLSVKLDTFLQNRSLQSAHQQKEKEKINKSITMEDEETAPHCPIVLFYFGSGCCLAYYRLVRAVLELSAEHIEPLPSFTKKTLCFLHPVFALCSTHKFWCGGCPLFKVLHYDPDWTASEMALKPFPERKISMILFHKTVKEINTSLLPWYFWTGVNCFTIYNFEQKNLCCNSTKNIWFVIENYNNFQF